MWRIDDDRQAIRCVGMLPPGPAQLRVAAAVLHRDDAPAYFEALERERVIAADDARTDPRTRDFRAAYLAPHEHRRHARRARCGRTTARSACSAPSTSAARARGPSTSRTSPSPTANLIVMALADEERREALARLADSEARARLIVDTAHDAFIGIDSAGSIVTWNAQAEATFGWTRDEALGRDMAETIIPPAFREAHHRGMRALPGDRRRAGRQHAASS